MSLPAAFVTSRVIREVIYGLLLGAEDSLPPPKSQPQDSSQQSARPTPGKTECDDEKPISGVQQEAAGMSESPQTVEDVSGDRNSSEQEEGVDKNSEHVKSEPSRDTLGIPGVKKTESCTNTSAPKQSENGVVEYTRHNKKELWRITVSARATLSGVGSLPPLENLPAVGLKERQAILTETLGVTAEFANQFDPSLQLYMMCLVFWAKNASPSVSLHLLKGLILSAVLLHVHREIADRENNVIQECIEKARDSNDTAIDQSGDGMKTRPTSETVQTSGLPHDHPEQQHSVTRKTTQKTEDKEGLSLSITGACRSEKDKVLTKVRDNLKKYYHDPAKISSKNPPVHEIFHGNAQFLACLLDTIHLNSLLCHPFPTLHLAHLFNGSFIYTIVHELQQRSNPHLFLSEMLVRGSTLTALFDSVCSAVVQETGENVFAEQKAQGKKCCKSAKNKKKASAAVSEKPTTVDRVWIAEDEAGQEELLFCDMNNRFHALLMDNDS